MLTRVEREAQASSLRPEPAARGRTPIVAPIVDAAFEPHLPRDHPAWVHDTLSISSRARALLESLRPIVLRVRSFWDHRLRCAIVGGARIEIEPSGCYRVER